jgi:N-acetylglucosaminyl-diphospho-decaprenol L-rhamnosyltransferase
MLRAEYPSVRLIANAANTGFAAATNQGIRASRGRYIMLLNPDTTVSADVLQVLVGFLDRHEAAGVAGPRLVGRDGKAQVSCFPLPTLGRELWRLFHLDALLPRAIYPASRWRTVHPQRVDTVQGACMLIRRSALAQTGLLDERYFVYTEEVDLCRRVLDAGWQLFWVPQAAIVHYGGASTSQVGARMFLQLYRSKIQYFRKYAGRWGAVAYKGILLAAALPRVALPALVVTCVPSRRAAWADLLRNYSSLLRALPTL